MRFQKGFAFLPVLFGIIIIAALVGGGAYVYTKNQHKADLIDVELTPAASSTSMASGSSNTSAVQVGGTEPVAIDGMYGCYAKNNTTVYYGSGISTEAIHFELPKDAVVISGADAATFQGMSPFGICFGKDKNHVYEGKNILPWADPATFSFLWYAKPGPILFYRNGTKIGKYVVVDDNLTPGTFSDVANGDPSTFEEIIGGYDFTPWAKDKNNVYCDGTILIGADPTTAKLDSQGAHMLVTVNGVAQSYDNGCKASSVAAVLGMSQYTDSDFGFSFWYPANWRVQKANSAISVIDPKDPNIGRYGNDGTWVSITETVSSKTSQGFFSSYVYSYDPAGQQWTYTLHTDCGDAGPTCVAQKSGVAKDIALGTTVGGYSIYPGGGAHGSGNVLVALPGNKILELAAYSTGAASFPTAIAGTITAPNASINSDALSNALRAVLNDHYYIQEVNYEQAH